MTKELIGAYTKPGSEYPGYVNVSRDGETVTLIVRGDPEIRENGIHVCGYAADRGKPGRCTPGDANCNNYCNMAPEKGPMQDHPKPGRRVFEGRTITLILTLAEFEAVKAAIGG